MRVPRRKPRNRQALFMGSVFDLVNWLRKRVSRADSTTVNFYPTESQRRMAYRPPLSPNFDVHRLWPRAKAVCLNFILAVKRTRQVRKSGIYPVRGTPAPHMSLRSQEDRLTYPMTRWPSKYIFAVPVIPSKKLVAVTQLSGYIPLQATRSRALPHQRNTP
jgi:hypothetical protein